jgi:hypothetical protein
MELTWAIIWSCLIRVPVRHWRTLFHYLRRLDMTFALARAEGRSFVNWHLREDGVIYVSEWALTEDEQARACTLPDGFDRAPWARLETGFAADLLARLCDSLARDWALGIYVSCGAAGGVSPLAIMAHGPASLPGAAPCFQPP